MRRLVIPAVGVARRGGRKERISGEGLVGVDDAGVGVAARAEGPCRGTERDLIPAREPCLIELSVLQPVALRFPSAKLSLSTVRTARSLDLISSYKL